MPANSADNIVHIEETLKSSLKNRGTIDSQIVSSSKRILLSHIGFQPAGQPYALQQETLKAKYIPLNSLKKSGSDHALHIGRYLVYEKIKWPNLVEWNFWISLLSDSEEFNIFEDFSIDSIFCFSFNLQKPKWIQMEIVWQRVVVVKAYPVLRLFYILRIKLNYNGENPTRSALA